MAKVKSYRTNDESLRALETIRPLTKGIKRTIRGWWVTITYLYVGTIVLLYFAKTHTSIVAGVFVFHVIIVVVIYFKNNMRNGRLWVLLKDYSNVKNLSMLSKNYQNLLNFTYLITFLDAWPFMWPIIWPIKFVFWFMYRVFLMKIKKVRKLILKGGLVLIPEEDEIAADPFYHFLIREGLYDEAIAIAEKDEAEEANETPLEEGEEGSEAVENPEGGEQEVKEEETKEAEEDKVENNG